VETGKIHLSIQQADVKEIIRYAIDATKTQAEQKKVLVEVHCPEDVQTVNADTEKTAWVLTNLISNAIRYSNENSKIVVSAKSIGKKMELSVQDFGKGIDSKYTDKIFDRYFRIPGTKQEGTGLGLAIGKEFIEAQGGEIKVESEIGQGSKFIFFLNT
jgi:signal transduction histidine kinase